MYQKIDRKTDYAKAVVNLHNKRVLLAPDPVSKSTLLLCTINKNEYLSKYYLQFSKNAEKSRENELFKILKFFKLSYPHRYTPFLPTNELSTPC